MEQTVAKDNSCFSMLLWLCPSLIYIIFIDHAAVIESKCNTAEIKENMTYEQAKATRAPLTTMKSRMFHRSRKYEPGWRSSPKSIILSHRKSQNRGIFTIIQANTDTLFVSRPL